MECILGGNYDDAKVAVYKFGAIENNNEEIAGKRNKKSRNLKDNDDKFRMKDETERASMFMQFLILYGRNFKASIRNKVSKLVIFFSVEKFQLLWLVI